MRHRCYSGALCAITSRAPSRQARRTVAWNREVALLSRVPLETKPELARTAPGVERVVAVLRAASLHGPEQPTVAAGQQTQASPSARHHLQFEASMEAHIGRARGGLHGAWNAARTRACIDPHATPRR